MKSFLKNILSSCLGSLLAFILLVLVGFVIIKSYTASNSSNQVGILHIPLSGTILDYESSGFDLQNFNFSSTNYTFWDLRNKINAASTDDNISGIFLENKDCQLSQQMVTELSILLENFKKSGKKIYSYSKYYDQNAYLLGTSADSIFLNPNGGVSIKGYAVYSPFFNKLLENYDIDVNIYYAGKYKSSTEPYRLDEFSTDNETQLKVYLTELYEQMIAVISKKRNIPKTKVKEIIASHRIYDSKYMKANAIVDGVIYRDEMIDFLDKRFENSELVKFDEYNLPKSPKKSDVAIVFAQGEIGWNETGTGMITHDAYAKIFKKIRENDKIKKVVLRIDSPGGNGYASDLLHREIELLRKADKKVYASMGSYATSGAYYIASACDSIFATENTMTGSIGVYIMLPNINRFLEEQLEITVDTVLSNPGALSYNPLLSVTEKQSEILKGQADDLYLQFKRKVAEGRGLTMDEVEVISQGRIWTGKDGARLGLVDRIAPLEELLQNLSAQKAVYVFPEQKSSFPESILQNGLDKFAISQNHEIKVMQSKVIEFQKLIEKPKPSMRLPYSINVTNQ